MEVSILPVNSVLVAQKFTCQALLDTAKYISVWTSETYERHVSEFEERLNNINNRSSMSELILLVEAKKELIGSILNLSNDNGLNGDINYTRRLISSDLFKYLNSNIQMEINCIDLCNTILDISSRLTEYNFTEEDSLDKVDDYINLLDTLVVNLETIKEKHHESHQEA